MFTFYHLCCVSPDYAPRYTAYCRVIKEKYLYGFLCTWENHICQFGEFVFILQSNRKPRTFSPGEQHVQNQKRETLMCIEELKLLGLIENKKESRKIWEYYDTKNQRECLGLRPGAQGSPTGIGQRGRREGGSECRIHVNPWLIHVNV